MGFSIQHLIVLLLIVVLVFGTKKLRNIGQDLGGAIKGFKEGMKQGETADEQATPATPAAKEATANLDKPVGQTIDVEVKREKV